MSLSFLAITIASLTILMHVHAPIDNNVSFTKWISITWGGFTLSSYLLGCAICACDPDDNGTKEHYVIAFNTISFPFSFPLRRLHYIHRNFLYYWTIAVGAYVSAAVELAPLEREKETDNAI
jgi:hypothetical protein